MKIKIRPGWIIRDLSTAGGGVTHDAKVMRYRRVAGGGTCTESRTSRTVDNVEICAALDALVKRVDYALRKHCARSTVGWFADDVALREVQAEVAQIQAEAEEVNNKAAAAGSERRATIEIWPLRVDLTVTPEAPLKIAGEIRKSLTEIRDAFREGRLSDLHKLKIRTRNMDRLVTGFPSEAIRFALARVPEAAREARARGKIKRGEARVDLDAIEAALACLDASPPSGTASAASAASGTAAETLLKTGR
jgi:hypothetical protein